MNVNQKPQASVLKSLTGHLPHRESQDLRLFAFPAPRTVHRTIARACMGCAVGDTGACYTRKRFASLIRGLAQSLVVAAYQVDDDRTDAFGRMQCKSMACGGFHSHSWGCVAGINGE